MSKRRDTRDDMMLKARAFSTYASRTGNPPEKQSKLEMAGFLALFHPELSDEKKQELIRDAGK